MKFLMSLILISFSFNSFALFGIFEKKVDPRTLTSYEDRMNYILQDPKFKEFYEAEKRKAEEYQKKLDAEWQRIEADLANNTNYTPEQQAQMKAEREAKQKKEFEIKLEAMKEEVLREFAISPEGEVVNIKEYEEKKRKAAEEKEALRRIQQFQSEEGLPLSKDINDVRFNTK